MLQKSEFLGVRDVLFILLMVTSVGMLIFWYGVVRSQPSSAELAAKAEEQRGKSDAKTFSESLSLMNQRLSMYNVRVTLTPVNGDPSFSKWSPMTETEEQKTALEDFALNLTTEFTKYPTDLVKGSELKTIGIVRDLETSGETRPALTMPQINSIVFDPVYSVNAGQEYTSTTINHEFWHFLDFKMRGDYRYADKEWSACNPPGFTYKSGGETAYDDMTFYNTFNGTKGFVTEYATYGIEEDRAEMFAWLMYDSSRVKELKDAGVDCKTKRLTAIVRTVSPLMSF